MCVSTCQFPTRSLREVEGGLSILIKDAKAEMLHSKSLEQASPNWNCGFEVAGNMVMVNTRSCQALTSARNCRSSVLTSSKDLSGQ